MPEFEDALHGTFEDFLLSMPHIETKIDEKGRLVRWLGSGGGATGGGGAHEAGLL